MSERKFTQGDLYGQPQARIPHDGARRYHVNHDFFGDVPSESRDYVLGLLATDGCVSASGFSFSICLKRDDRDVLEQVRRAMDFTGQLTDVSASLRRKRFPSTLLQVNCIRLVKALANFGIVPRKTTTLRVEGVEDSPHFWRGVIDGDGCIMFRRRRSREPQCKLISASPRFIEQFAAFVHKRLPGGCETAKTYPPGKQGKTPIRRFILNGYRAVSLLHLLYDGCSIALPRKKALAEEAFAWATGPGSDERRARRRSGRPKGSRNRPKARPLIIDSCVP